MNFDRQITIAVGGSRTAKKWKPETMMWSELCARLQVPRRSTETLVAYKAMSKPRQDELKDVGGFVGGTFRGDVRKAGAAIGRDLVALDLDNIPGGQTEDVLRRVSSLGCAYVVYSTRKHEAAAPRLRVLLPFSQTIHPDLYEPAARALGYYIGLDFCDPSTFEVNRMMYWPNVCRDSEYVFLVGDAPFVDAVALLGVFYKDWRDMSTWPSITGEVQPHKLAAKQGDPEEKHGLVGAFCRAYDVPAAIAKFIPDAYVETVTPGRYTYTGGSTAGGAVIYDEGKFLYSHHATDPCSGRLVNSFDLVRLHLFGDLDDRSSPDTATVKLPSYLRMMEHISGDEATIEALAQETMAAIDAFAPDEEEDGNSQSQPGVFGPAIALPADATVYPSAGSASPAASDAVTGGDVYTDPRAWMKQLQRNPTTGQAVPTIANCQLILSNDPNVKDKIRYNEFSSRREVFGVLPWARTGSRAWNDVDQAGLYSYFEAIYGISKRASIDCAADLVAAAHSFDDVKSYLAGLIWDGVPRLDTLFVDYLGVPDTPYARAVTRKSMVAAVARVRDPGCKYDTMPVISGPQGIGKSTMLSKLSRGWFTDALRNFEGKDAAEIIQGVWLVEIGELGAMKKADTDRVKQFLSQRADRFRAAYARYAQECPRRCVFIGTVNEDEYLRDQTGNRRFWPLDAYKQAPRLSVFRDLDANVDQIWAEAVARYESGETLFLEAELTQAAMVAQELHRERYLHEDTVVEFLHKRVPHNWSTTELDVRMMFWEGYERMTDEAREKETRPRDRICAREIWVECLGFKLDRMTRIDATQINAVIARMPGWFRSETALKFGPHGTQKGYQRKLP